MNPVAITGLLVAAIRAEESQRSDRLFEDPFAAALAGEAGRDVLARYRAASGRPSMPIIEVRTRYYDEGVARALQAGLRQFVILAAGMDARAYRLAWPEGTHVFEVDQPDVIAHKAAVLRSSKPACVRVAIGQNLANDWLASLVAEGFDPQVPTAWLVEGLLQYLDAQAVETLFARIDSLAARRSILLYDVVGQSLLKAPPLAPTLRMMAELGAPWIFGTDDPQALVASRGWDTRVIGPDAFGARWGRWPFPPAPPGVPGIPRGYFVEATKR